MKFTDGVATKTLNNLAVGEHIINIKYDGATKDKYGDLEWTGKLYSNTFYVTVNENRHQYLLLNRLKRPM